MDRTLRLMIVDDNLHARKALSAFISAQKWSQSIEEATNGKDAIEQIEGHVPDLILMDIQMPVMDGLQATRVIKKRWPQIKVILLTMYADYQPQAWQAGADAFLLKGCSVEEMKTTFDLAFPAASDQQQDEKKM